MRLVEAEPDVAHVLLKPGEDQFLVLGSDGLFDVLSPEDVVRLANRILLKDKHSGLGGALTATAPCFCMCFERVLEMLVL